MKYLQSTIIKYSLYLLLLCMVGVFFDASSVSAATLSASTGNAVSAKDTAIIDVYLNTEGEVLNSVDGSVVLSDTHNGNFEVKELSTVNSKFTMWARKPSLSSGGVVSFVGGTPGGIQGEKVLMFKLVVKINDAGDFTIAPRDLTAYLNDGLGTSRQITKNSSTISVSTAREIPQDSWKQIISNDNVAPLPFTITMIHDSNLYGGKKYLSFETIDQESGISYYQVKEGDLPAVRTGTEYLLNDQNGSSDVVVTAYDKAGNFQVAIYSPEKSTNWMIVGAILVFIVVLYFTIKILRKRRRNAS